MAEIKVGLLGFGTVGTGLAQLFFEHGERLDRRLGAPIRLTRIADLDLTTDRGVEVPAGVLTDSVEAVIDDPAIQVVVELIGGLEPARSFILRALEAGKRVVTANKALLAEHGNEIFKLAEERGSSVFFEAAVAGGIPIIRSIREGMAANRVERLTGILNGTCNYILTRMSKENEPFETALAAAQAEGYAEADPTLDIEGLDAAHKLAILVSLAFGGPLQFSKLYVEGIQKIEAMDIVFAREFDYVIKLLALARRIDGQIEARVHPTMIPESHVLAAVNGPFNAIHMSADPVGEVLFYGQGAGRKPTASAVAGDVIDAARDILSGARLRVPNLGEPGRIDRPLSIRPMDELVGRHYLRLTAIDRPGVLSAVAGLLGRHNISIESVIQKGQGLESVPVVMLTHRAREADVKAALAGMEALEVLTAPPVHLRIEEAA